MNQESYTVVTRAEALALISEHVTQNIVRMDGSHFLRQKVGIAQGGTSRLTVRAMPLNCVMCVLE